MFPFNPSIRAKGNEGVSIFCLSWLGVSFDSRLRVNRCFGAQLRLLEANAAPEIVSNLRNGAT